MSRPLVTFMLRTYNHERFIREAVGSALAQTYSPLQVVISDDCSQDRTFEIIQEEVAGYVGPHQILLNRNERNLGIGGNRERAMELAEGELIVNAEGDDISLPHRTEELVKVWSKPNVSCVYSGVWKFSEDGRGSGKALAGPAGPPAGPVEQIESWQEVVQRPVHEGGVGGASAAYDRAVFDAFGPLPARVIHDDYVLEFRSALLGKIAAVDTWLVKYRRHDTNATGRADLKLHLPQFIEYQAKQSKSFSDVYKCWLRDGRIFAASHPEAESEISRAMKTVAARAELEEFRATAAFCGRVDRLRSCARIIRNVKRLGLEPIAKACLIAASPTIYHRVQRRWYRELARREAQR